MSIHSRWHVADIQKLLQAPWSVEPRQTHCRDAATCRHEDSQGHLLKHHIIPHLHSRSSSQIQSSSSNTYSNNTTDDNAEPPYNKTATNTPTHNKSTNNSNGNGNGNGNDDYSKRNNDINKHSQHHSDSMQSAERAFDVQTFSHPPSTADPHHSRTGFDIISDSSLPLTRRLWYVFGQWKRIDYTLSFIQWIGTILFNINAVGTSGLFDAGESPGIDDTVFYGLTVFPDITASCTFVIAGYLQIVEAVHRSIHSLYTTSKMTYSHLDGMLDGTT